MKKGKLKKRTLIDKLIFIVNFIFAILLLFSFLLPYISPKSFPKITLLSLTVPILFIVNVLFLVYYCIKGLKRQLFLSGICLLIGLFVSTPFYKLKRKILKSEHELSIMNYNVRLLNAYEWTDDKEIPSKIEKFVKEENPDIICMQEFHLLGKNLLNNYEKFIKTKEGKNKIGQVIFSKYKIINRGSLDFKNTQNNAIFIDFVKELDTIRVYNLHLESLGLKSEIDQFDNEIPDEFAKKLINRLKRQFSRQQEQVDLILEHQKQCHYPTLVCGDFNNNAYSWTYKKIKGDMQDSFLEAGSKFGRTFSFNKFPMRIDFVLVDKILQVNEHKNYNVKLSDHYPIMVRVGLD